MTVEIWAGDPDYTKAVDLAKKLDELYNSGDTHLTSIKVDINPEFRKANIFAGYEDTARLKESGSEDTMGSLCEAFIEWPESEGENTKESWKYFTFAKTQMKRAYILSELLKTQLIVLPMADDLKCYVKNGVPYIEEVFK
jgi:hypothetical protein